MTIDSIAESVAAVGGNINHRNQFGVFGKDKYAEITMSIPRESLFQHPATHIAA
jgi:hypothetical protein